ncbi:hypothetical protein AVEN_206142-1 [Araneus ventricosus]|uniref:Endonuclease/exonuclease/phosphatase domain-containing protein n=1 Tax=Araneus ventricosus TaxID=182803 RepID=A0A4Y2LWU3_ARAVE|nr:hypothetical protein AVEN_206142-1 [Araneus ventricosus]
MLSNLVTICTLYSPQSTNVNDRDLDRLVEELPTPSIIIGGFNDHSPLWGNAIILKSGLTFPKKRKPWWNKHCTDTTRNQRKSWNVFRRHPTSANQIAFQRAKSIARWFRRNGKREYWIKFGSNINSSVTAKDIRDTVRGVRYLSRKRISCLQKNSQEVRNTLEMVDILAEAFASICSASNYTEPLLTYKKSYGTH